MSELDLDFDAGDVGAGFTDFTSGVSKSKKPLILDVERTIIQHRVQDVTLNIGGDSHKFDGLGIIEFFQVDGHRNGGILGVSIIDKSLGAIGFFEVEISTLIASDVVFVPGAGIVGRTGQNIPIGVECEIINITGGNHPFHDGTYRHGFADFPPAGLVAAGAATYYQAKYQDKGEKKKEWQLFHNVILQG